MIVHFGLHADGLDPAAPRTVLGEVRVGPRGLLELLETDLGLPPVLEHAAAQLARYRSCLADANDLMRFYHASFGVDPIAVARELLHWRATWYESGWDGQLRTPEPRLADMAAVESLARERAAPCMGQRLTAAAQALQARRAQIERLVLLDDADELPPAWRRVVDRIGYEVHPGVFPTPSAPPGTDLALLQATLARPDTPATGPLRGDGTVLVVRAESPDASARAVAEYLRAGTADQVVIAERDGIVFDNALERAGLPRCGFHHRSRFRAVSQVPALALALLWEPIDPRLLLQFLLHPVAPLPRRVRRPLAEAVAEQPGTGGMRWAAAVAALLEADETDPDKTAADIRYWLQSARFDAESGAPVDAILERTRRCARWLERRRATAPEPEHALYTATVSQCKALSDALAQLAEDGRTSIGKAELDHLLDEAAVGQPDPLAFAQARHVRATTHPGAVVTPVDEVFWWDLRPQPAEPAPPWSDGELTALASAGVDLPSPAERIRRRRRAWLRPVLQCRRRLVLIAHRPATGRHPLLAEIEHRCPGFAELPLDKTLLDGGLASLPHLGVATPTLPVQPLQPPRRWWSLRSSVELPPRPVESYTSLAKLCDFPHEWVLGYLARLRPGRAADLHDRGLLYGSLAHRLFERFFDEHADRARWGALSTSDLRTWLDASLDHLFATEGAVLLQRGRGGDRHYVADRIERALERLLDHLRSANIVEARSETHQAAQHTAFDLRGTIDLLLTREDGRRVVMDVKWSSEPYRQQEMQAGRHLQLATYAWLDRESSGRNEWPYPAYFIVLTGNVIAPDAAVFPDAIVAAPESGGSIAELWERAEATHAWRREQLDGGLIEVHVSGADADERSRRPDDALVSPDAPDRFDDFGLLTGIDPSR